MPRPPRRIGRLTPRKRLVGGLSERFIGLSVSTVMANELKRYADEDGLKLSPFIRRICTAYCKRRAQQAALDAKPASAA